MSEFTLLDHKHNLKYNLIHEFAWGFGIAFHTLYAIVPLFLRELGAPESIAVSTAGLFSILIALPSLFIAALGRNIQNIKRAVILFHGIILIVSFLMGFTFTVLDPIYVQSAWKLYLFYFVLYAFSIGIIVPIWAEFLNQSTLKSERGKFFGLGFAFNGVGSFVGGFALQYLLTLDLPFPRNFGIGFIILFISLLIGTILFIPFKIKPKKTVQTHKTIKSFIKETKSIIIGHKNFQKYILSRIFFAANLPGMGLYAVYCQNKFHFDLSEAGLFTILNVLAAGASSYLSGKLGDKYGHKMSMLFAYIGHFIAVILAIFSQNMIWVYGVFLAIGVGQGAFMPSAMNLVYNFAEDRDTKTYMALIDSFLAPFVLIFIIGVGSLIRIGDFTTSLYIIATSLFISILVLQFLVRDPNSTSEPQFHLDGFSS
ncbi:MAG: MFS transporter [Candidatus Marinimicrobia bacterium]|jgi:MFS family permease|nr:MFS transporter [Candidatus Neomarinimicrobiota bacterium]MBT3838396.1 MFS transporter [Candidatus Neomarinimicrobiota bacterium]MBT3998701.1 MFS transporter [Candidatus Neomarinimicrobiota bacterium]MBT4283280.1 MFS transporter [Candidatus Neomarinimicrobiota bacterium]MBT4578407.1 MFS transporter [Candidatus Neomarinimicrobiota bacterium]